MKKKVQNSDIKTKTRQEMASDYGIDRKTFYRWLKRANLPITNGLLCPLEIELIYNTFGKPGNLK